MVTCEKKEAELKREGKFSQGQEGLRAQNGVLCLGHFLLKSGFQWLLRKAKCKQTHLLEPYMSAQDLIFVKNQL